MERFSTVADILLCFDFVSATTDGRDENDIDSLINLTLKKLHLFLADLYVVCKNGFFFLFLNKP